MDPVSNETPKENNEKRPRPRKRRKQFSLSSIQLPAFARDMLSKKDVRWYFDVRLYSPLILLLLILALWPCGHKTQQEPAVQNVPMVTEATEQDIVVTAPAPRDPDAEALAVLADSAGAGYSKNVKKVIMWIAVNRSEAGGVEGYGKSLREEISRPDQWQGYDPNASYSEEAYEMAVEVLEIIAGGDIRPVEPDMLWLVMNADGSVTIRNTFYNTGKNSYERTIK